ncbi:hypothetical protein BLA24_24890 [Streptomyces cinnamoneus]|uniref:Uncharacterized protein n=1 Tax=Streptomyces cinnamoneus TaxID=53446 RepID=A0A2G1XDJ1_STRCJ|nr:hypothetical protein [Streptomyces cinnamoneus]PHQ49298.1 hypothetical protein BLA24_24890 [Streptomyces cinnamoneus]PPT15052.1 hypothetical protein CYQ11_21180 [Streptomyces cinnamoneus]
MSHAVDAVDAAAIALNERSWTPSDYELTLARDFLTRRDGLPPRLLPGMPACPSPQGWVTQHVLWLEDVSHLADGLLAAWRDWLADGPMVALLAAYANLARSAVPLAAQLAQDWAAEWQAPPSAQETSWWEDWRLPAEQRRQIDALTDRLIMAGAVVVMAVNRGETGR